MNDESNELKKHLQGTLAELNRLSEQIRTTRDYSKQAEYILCLREFVLEQFEMAKSEDTYRTDHASR